MGWHAGIARSLEDVSAVGRLAGSFGLGLHLGFDDLLDRAPITVERRYKIAAGLIGQFFLRQEAPLAAFFTSFGSSSSALKKVRHRIVDR